MKRSGKTNRVDPSDMAWAKSFPGCAKLFQKAGWYNYFETINGYHSDVSYKFSQGLEKDTVLFNTIKIELTRELIAEATTIANEGEFWFKKVPFTFNSEDFLLHDVVEDWGKGVHIYRISILNGGSLLRFCRVI